MKQLMYIKKNKLEWHDTKEPTLQSAGDVIVRTGTYSNVTSMRLPAYLTSFTAPAGSNSALKTR